MAADYNSLKAQVVDSMKKHIYVAYTGGTIGMRPSSKGYVPAPGFLNDTLAKMPEFHRDEMPDFSIHEYVPLLDSSDMQPQHWQQIAEDIRRHYQDYDGFIILHGTDTMAYTASALSFMFENLEKPVIVTGSQIPLAQLRSDGQENLLNALYIAANYPIPEVSLFFSNRLFRGNRARKLDADGFEAFGSPNFPPLLEAGINIRIKAGKVTPVGNAPLRVSDIHPQPIGVISLYPGLSTDVVKNTLQQPVKALLLLSYGVGNAPQSETLLRLLKDAWEREVIVLNCTQCLRGRVNMDGYANGKILKDIGVVSGQDMTPEAALAKLHYVLSQPVGFDDKLAMLAADLRGEITLP